MNYLTLDFETAYSKEFSLSKMPTQAYIMDPQFKVLMVGMKWGDGETVVHDEDQVAAALARVDWSTTALVCHNAAFDASILHWRYGIKPAFLCDTMSMAQFMGLPLLTGSASLEKLVRLLQEQGFDVPPKGHEVVNALGKMTRSMFNDVEWRQYRSYCANDVNITWYLFKVLRQYVSDRELAYQDMILRCYTEPMFMVHKPTVEYELQRVRAYKAEQMAEVCRMLNTTQDELAGVLRSNDKFADLLRSVGGITQDEMDAGKQGAFLIPTKVSATTGKTTWAFSKNDVGFKELCDSDLPAVQAICQARMAAKSSIDETRCETMLGYTEQGFLALGYKIGGAHTNRMSGGSNGCLTADTVVICLTDDGCIVEKLITDVHITDLVWDGEEWCEHDGVVFSGYQEVIEYDGIRGTRCHQVFTDENTSLRLDCAASSGARIMDCPTPEDWEHRTNR